MIHVDEHKTPQHNLASEKFINPKKLYLPLSQHTGKPSLPCVKVGDKVEQAQMLAREDGFISATLHSPSSGKIIAIDDCYHPQLKRAKCIIVECIGEEKRYSLKTNINDYSKEKLIETIKQNGIVGMGGAAFPTHVKLSPPKPIETLIINGCECEPYLAADYRLMVEYLDGVFKGIEIISKIIAPKNIIFTLEDNKPEAIKKVNLLINTKKITLPNLKLVILKSTYPQGSEKQLIYSTTSKKVPAQGLPLDVGCLVHNVGTCFAIYEAIYLNKPLIERMVTFAGDALVSPKNIWLKIGTTIRELIDNNVLKFKTDPAKIIYGGPMMGIALDSLDYPILKGTGGFLFLSNNVSLDEEGPCIRCGSCVRECPVCLMPCLINLASLRESWEETKRYGASDCIECGVCSYVCPTNRRLVQSIKRAKLEILG
ncbi:MAG: electron transport complex subunit RsxC [Candidatus Omnitrophota bacterium]|nr:electron transport complex subunit RsxC [Candidatus Omnitrophota bacterium]